MRVESSPRECAIDACARRAYCRNWCKPHYERWRKYGDPFPLIPIKTWRNVTCRRGHSDWSPTRISATGYPVRECQTCNRESKQTTSYRKRKAGYHRKELYGITPAEFDALLTLQDGVCAICGRPMIRPSVDHNHQTGAIRGVLCNSCNIAIGLLQDSPEVLRAAAAYLESH